MSVSGVSERRTSDLVDDLAHQAGIVDKDHHVSGDPRMKSGAQLHKERHGSTKLSEKLNEPKNAGMKAAFQARADEGFVAAERAAKAVAHLPEAERPAAFGRWMKDNGFGDRLENDVAFGKGVEYAKWVHTEAAKKLGVDAHAEIEKVENRQPAPQVFRRAG